MIYEVLKEGKENAMTKKQLCEMFGITAETLRLQIQKERLNGVPILSSTEPPGGYFKPSGIEELLEYKRSQESRIRQISKGLKPVRLEIERAKLKAQHGSVLIE